MPPILFWVLCINTGTICLIYSFEADARSSESRQSNFEPAKGHHSDINACRNN